jgi:hypothetical protein
MQSINVPRRVPIPETPREWELYVDMPGAESAAADLTTTLRNAIEQGRPRGEVEQEVFKVMRQHRNLGALDSEPIGHLRHALDTIFGEDR